MIKRRILVNPYKLCLTKKTLGLNGLKYVNHWWFTYFVIVLLNDVHNNVLYFLPLFDRPKINIVFSNTLKARSCIAKPVHNSKTTLQRKRNKTHFLKCRFSLLVDDTHVISYLIFVENWERCFKMCRLLQL